MDQISTSVMMHLNFADVKIEADEEPDRNSLPCRIRIRFGQSLTIWLNENQVQDLQNRIEEVLESLEKERFESA